MPEVSIKITAVITDISDTMQMSDVKLAIDGGLPAAGNLLVKCVREDLSRKDGLFAAMFTSAFVICCREIPNFRKMFDQMVAADR